VIEVASKMLVKDERHPALFSETPISATNAIRLNKLRRHGYCCIGTHGAILGSLSWMMFVACSLAPFKKNNIVTGLAPLLRQA